MGNCQAAEAATVVLQHPGNAKVERIHWSVSASEVMGSNPGHYVALVVQQPLHHPSYKNNGQAAVKNHLKLLRPDDTLHVGHVYRLISFEDVIKEFSAKKSAKLGKLLKRSVVLGVDKKKNLDACGSNAIDENNTQLERERHQPGNGISCSRGVRRHGNGGPWKPLLQSIAEI